MSDLSDKNNASVTIKKMTTISANTVQSISGRTMDIHIDMETVYPRDQPPPYMELDIQPHTIIRETIILQPPLKDTPMFYPCPKCYKRVLTKVKYKSTKKTHMMAGFIFGCGIFCLLCGLALIPYCIPTFKKIEHYCPECNTLLGDYSKV